MIWTLIAAAFAALTGGGIALGLRKAFPSKTPGWLVPVSAGLCMLAATVAMEYAWYPNNIDDLPEDRIVLSERQQKAIYQPWTYIKPWVKGFVAFSPSETRPTLPTSQVYVVQAHIYERWQPAMIRPFVVDCATNERFDLQADTVIGDDGRPENSPAIGSEGDPLIMKVCASQ